MAVKEKTRAPAPVRSEATKAPSTITPKGLPALPNPLLKKKTTETSEAETPVQRARASVAMQQRVGNARAGQMMSSAPAATLQIAGPPEKAGSKPSMVVPKIIVPLIAPKAAPEKERKAPAEKGLTAAPEKETAEATSPAKADTAAKESKAPGTTSAPEDKGTSDKAEGAETRGKEAKPAAEAGGEAKPPAADGGKKSAAEGESAPLPEEGAGKSAPVAVKLQIPEPPSEISPATKKRIGGVQARAGGAAKAHSNLPEGAKQVGDARKAVDEPNAEAIAKAQAALISQVPAAPSPEIVKLCERIRDVIYNKRPPDQDALMEAKPDAAATSAGNQLNSTVEGETKKVQDNYGAVNAPPGAVAPAKGEGLAPQPPVGEAKPINAKAATPDAVPAENVSLDADAAESKKKMEAAGMEKPAAQLVQSGPVAEARGAQGELDQAAKEDPAKVLAGQQEALGKAEANMAALQAQALEELTKSRAATVESTASRQQGMVGSEDSMRTKASAEAKKAFEDAQKSVNALLKPVASNAMEAWDKSKDVLVTKFKADLAIVKQRVDERHKGVGGFFTGLWDAVAGLPSWAEAAYTTAERNFGDGVIAKLTEISIQVNSVIATCDLIIKNARDRIAKIFADLPESLRGWATQEQGKFDGQLDQLHNQAISARDSFNKELKDSASAAVDEVRTEIAELRKKAGGLVGRIVSAVNRFLDDPVKFIIEGLLELLGIPPAAFWAVVAKIKQVVKDIADDPMKFGNNLLAGLAKGFSQFFDNFFTHMVKGFISWITGGLGDVGVQLPKDFSLKSIITFFLQLMGITWPRIRKVLAKHVGEKNVALLEKVYSLLSLLIEKGPEGIYEMIKEKLDPQSILDQVIDLAVDFMVSAIIKAATARIILLFNPAGAILQALEAIYRVLKWIFQNAARIFTLVETVVNGIADILAGSIGGFANAVEKALAMLIAPVISFIADYLGFGDLPDKIANKIKTFQDWIMSLIEKALVWLIEKGKALLAAFGIGKKDDKKDKKDGTPHEQAVHEVATTLAEPPPGEPLEYKALRAAKEKEAQTLVAMHNQSLAAEHVKMSVTFADPSKDQVDHDLDFSVRIGPNDSVEDNSVAAPVPEPVAGLHVVPRPAPFESVAGESHHVPAKGLGSGIGQFLDQVASELQTGEWKDDPEAAAVASAFATRATENQAAAAPPGPDLSAMLMSPEGHTKEGGVHTIEGSGPILAALALDPAVVQVKRRTETKIESVTSYLAVNPQIASWRLFLADIRRALDDPGFQNQAHLPPSDVRAVELILAQAQKDFMTAEKSAKKFLQARVVDRTNEVLDRSVGDAYINGKATVAAAMERAKDGTPEGRKAALSSLDAFYKSSWRQFREPIKVEW
ncbi:MAG: hypothetical protein AABN95_03475 [Acidobacteriota bacterium]